MVDQFVPHVPPAARPLVGRDAELDTILTTLRDCFHGRPKVLLVTGEPGVGKTRLMSEVGVRATAELGATTLTGFAIEGGAMPPYFPISRAIRDAVDQLVQSGPEIRQAASLLAAAGLVRPDFPEYRTPASLTPDAERVRLYDAFADVCLRLANASPLLLLLDDLQWADSGTWEMVSYAVRVASAAPFGVVVACRDEILAPGTAGTQALDELNRNRLLVHLPLPRLTPDAVRLLGRGFLGSDLADGLAAVLAQRSEGNPFYAEEVLRGLSGLLVQDWSGAYYLPAKERAAAEAATPATLKLSIVRRLNNLPAETRSVLMAASVLGRSFSSRLLARMRGQTADEVERCLEPALSAGVISGSGGNFAFAHDLIRETAYSLLAGDRRRLHEAAARALAEDADRGFERLAALAHHWREADEPLLAARAAQAAAEAASRAAAHTEALQHASSACDLFERVLGKGAEIDEVVRAHLTLAEAALTCGDYTLAEATYRRLLADATQRADRQLQGQAWARLGVLFRRRERMEESSACFTNALDVLEESGEGGRVAAEVLIELAGLEGLTRARYAEATAYGQRALAVADALGDRRLQANAAMAMAGIRIRAIDPKEGPPLLQQALGVGQCERQSLLPAEACAALSNTYYWTGELQRSHQYARRRLELAEQAGDVFGMRHAHSWLAIVLLTLGRWTEARELLNHCAPLLARLDNPEPVAFVRQLQAVIAYQLGDMAESYEHATQALQVFEDVDPATTVWYRGVLVLICIALGRKDEGERHLRLLEAHVNALPESALLARSARTVLGLAYVELGDHKRAAACERALRPYASDHHWWLTRRTLANLAAFRGDVRQALDDLALAEEHARREDLTPDLALILLRKSESIGPSSTDGRTALQEARRLLESLGMQAALARADRLLGSATLASPEGLTAREMMVLRLIASGKTNREISQELFISEHTVVNHLSHIFAKIGVDNRTAAAAFALRQGIV